jgi:hypothetical protein
MDPSTLLSLAASVPALVSATKDVLSPSSNSSSPSQSPNNLPSDPAPLAAPAALSQSSFSTSALSLPRQPRPAPRDLKRHFQWNTYDLTGTETGVTSIDIQKHTIITNLARGYNLAILDHLFVQFSPKAECIKYPVTCEVLWAPESADIGTTHIMDTYGSARLVAGSITNPGDNLLIHCDLVNDCNPIMKSPIAFNNCPRLYLKFYQNADSVKLGINAPISASLFIKGAITLISPSVCATYK